MDFHLPIAVHPIGIVHSAFAEVAGVPIQPNAAEACQGTIEVQSDYAAGLADLPGFERIWVLTWLHRVLAPRLLATPFLDTRQRGIFATRAPCRPNPIGLSCVRLVEIAGCTIRFAGCDLVDGTPVLDIKPYVPAFDAFPSAADGWYAGQDPAGKRADRRFAAGNDGQAMSHG